MSACFCDVICLCFFCGRTNGFIFNFFTHKGVQLFICYFASHHKAAQWTDYEGCWVCGILFRFSISFMSSLSRFIYPCYCCFFYVVLIPFWPSSSVLCYFFSILSIEVLLTFHCLITVFTFYFDSWIYRKMANFHPQKWRQVKVKSCSPLKTFIIFIPSWPICWAAGHSVVFSL